MSSSSGNPRRPVHHGGRVIYEWSQDLEEVNAWIATPPGLPTAMIDCAITGTHVTLGIKGNAPYLDEELGGSCTSDSLWTMEDGVIHITLYKSALASVWPCFSQGPAVGIGQSPAATNTASSHTLSAAELEAAQRAILMQRFERENPTFDFSNANLSGAVPDPSQFMGGIDRKKLS